MRSNHINAGLMRVLDRMEDTPAQVENLLGETLKQTRLAVALLGDETSYVGMERIRAYRWFTEVSSRAIFPLDDHPAHSTMLVARLSAAYAAMGPASIAQETVEALLRKSQEFAEIWDLRPVAGPYCEPKRIQHPELGLLELYGQTLLDPDQSQALVIFTAVPGSETYDKLELLSVIGNQRL